jgi:hypothetical protein
MMSSRLSNREMSCESNAVPRALEGRSRQIPLARVHGGRCPPEDCGGTHGYSSSSRPSPIRNTSPVELIEWIGYAFDPNDVEFDARAEDLATLAKTWAC